MAEGAPHALIEVASAAEPAGFHAIIEIAVHRRRLPQRPPPRSRAAAGTDGREQRIAAPVTASPATILADLAVSKANLEQVETQGAAAIAAEAGEAGRPPPPPPSCDQA